MSASRKGLPPRLFHGPGGLRIVVAENHSSPITSVAVYCLGGARNERASRQGITHFAQRMLLKGTSQRNAEQLADELEFLGARFAPFTSKDMVGASLSILSRNFGQGLERMAECLLDPIFHPDEVEKERRLVLAEIRRRHDDSFAYAMELSERALFGRHPYAFSVGGTEATVNRLGAEELARWHSRLYSPERMVVAVVGDLRATEMRDRIAEAFAALDRPRQALPEPTVEAPPSAPRLRSRRREKKHVALALSFMAPAFPSEDFFAFDVLNQVLSGMGGRLFVELRDRRGLGYTVGSTVEPRKDIGHFCTYIGTSREQRKEALAGILDELRRVREELVPQDEVSRTRKYLLGLFEIALQRKSVQAGRLAFYELLGGGFGVLGRYPQLIRSVTPEAMLEAARRHLDPEAYTCGQVVPR